MIPIFDNGHGGMINKVYQTAGKRSPNWDKGVLYEGVFNRLIVRELMHRCTEAGIPFINVSNSETDVPLSQRVRAANLFYAQQKVKGTISYLLSVHANAGGGNGWEIFTSRGQTKSDKIASIFGKHLTSLPNRLRADTSDGDIDKEADFYVLTQTRCPAVLLECAFMDSKPDYDLLHNVAFRAQLVDLLFDAIVELYNISNL